MVKCKITVHIKQIALLAPATGILYVKDSDVWVRYTS